MWAAHRSGNATSFQPAVAQPPRQIDVLAVQEVALLVEAPHRVEGFAAGQHRDRGQRLHLHRCGRSTLGVIGEHGDPRGDASNERNAE